MFRISAFGNSRSRDRLERPVLRGGLRDGVRGGERELLRPRRAEFDPLLERGDLAVGELAVRRHLQVVVGVLDRRRASRLSFGLPGTTTGPPSPPFSIASRVSSRSPPFAFSAAWHDRHFSTSTGRTLFSKNSAAGSAAHRRAGEGRKEEEQMDKTHRTCSGGWDALSIARPEDADQRQLAGEAMIRVARSKTAQMATFYPFGNGPLDLA